MKLPMFTAELSLNSGEGALYEGGLRLDSDAPVALADCFGTMHKMIELITGSHTAAIYGAAVICGMLGG